MLASPSPCPVKPVKHVKVNGLVLYIFSYVQKDLFIPDIFFISFVQVCFIKYTLCNELVQTATY